MLILAFLSAKNVATLLFLKSFSFVAGLARFSGEIWGVLNVFFLFSCFWRENRENKYLLELRVSSCTRAHYQQTYTFCFHNLHRWALSFHKNDWQTMLFRPPI